MFTVNKAIIMAAGLGSRLNPLTLDIPKPLIKVQGIPLIEGLINHLLSKNIVDIYVVIGYKKESFYYLEKKYPTIKLLYNPYYKIHNNISSLFVAKDYLENVIILDADQIINNPSILQTSITKPGYCCAPINSFSKEWILTISNDRIHKCYPNGYNKGYQLYSLSFWDSTQGSLLRKFLITEYISNQNTAIYWDDIWRLHLNKFDLGVHIINKNDIIEIDTINELCSLDSTYLYLINKERPL